MFRSTDSGTAPAGWVGSSASSRGRAAGVACLLAGSAVGLAVSHGPLADAAPGPALEAPGFHHLHLNSADPASAGAFYVRYFPTASATTVAGHTAVRTGTVLLLFSDRTPQAATPSAYWHFGWHVPSATAAWQRYRSTGAPLTPLFTDDGSAVTFSNEWWPGVLTRDAVPAARTHGVRPTSGGYGYLSGPDGARIEFQGDLPAERFNHVHMFQEDVYCAELWYARHLGAPLSAAALRSRGRRTDPADCRVPLGEPSWLSLVPEGTRRTPAGGVVFDDVELNWYQRQGSQPLAPSRGGVMDHVGLRVLDLDAWVSRLRRDGVRVLDEPHAFGAGRAAMIEGPSREAIELVEEAR